MSQSTRCPACHARFKVVADQLRISDGWVRCGECGQIFDATTSLEVLEPPALLPDLDLDSLRGPLEKVKLDPVSDAWQAPTASAAPSVQRADNVPTSHSPEHPESAQKTLSKPLNPTQERGALRQTVNTRDIEADISTHAQAQQRDTLGVHSDAPVYTPTWNAQPGAVTPPPSATTDAEGVPWQLGDAARVDVSADTVADGDTQALKSATEAPRNPWKSHTDAARGYELPGSQTESGGDEALPSPIAQPARTVVEARVPAAARARHRPVKRQWFDREEPVPEPDLDLAHFFVDSAPAPYSDRFDDTVPADLMGTADPVPRRYTQGSLPAPLQPEPVAAPHSEPQSAPDLHDLQVPRAEPEAHSTLEDDGSDQRQQSRDADADADAEIEVDVDVDVDVDEEENTDASEGEGEGEGDGADPAHHNLGSALSDSLPDPEWGLEHGAEPTFVRHARQRAFWSRTQVKVSLWCSALVLALLLCGQLALQHRDYLSARFPQARTALVNSCEVLGCAIEPLSDIGAILVEGSSFNRVRGDDYTFLLTLRNRSQLEVRAPAIELTLTDVQDQPVVRRVLTAQELDLPTAFLPEQEWGGEIPMTMESGTARIAGFRVVAFYPQ